MKPFLLDTNVLIALAWPNHVHHRDTVDWFRSKGVKAFRTCPLTQTGFVRISSNPAFMPDPPSPREAIALLKRLTALPGHAFWPDNLSIVDALAGDTVIATHHQVRDGYLLRLAVVHEGILATLDRGIQPIARGYPDRLEIIL